MKVIDLRDRETWEIGNSMELSGDSTILYMTTDKGYRLVMDAYNMKQIADHYYSKGEEK